MDKAEEYFQTGLAAYKKGDCSTALGEWQKSLQEDPLHSKAIYYYAKVNETVQGSQKTEDLSARGQQAFSQKNYQDALVAWYSILEIDPNNEFAKTNLVKTKEAYQSCLSQNSLVEENKEAQFFKEALQYFRQKNYSKAAVLWETVLIVNAKNDQARQGLDKARSFLIQAKEQADQEKQTKINSYLQEGLDAYGAGEAIKAINAWRKILELDLDNKDALDYIVVAKADLSDADLSALTSGSSDDTAEEQVTDTIKLDQALLDAEPADENFLLDQADDPGESMDFDKQTTDKTSLPNDFDDAFSIEEEAFAIEEEDALEIETDDSVNLDDDFSESLLDEDGEMEPYQEPESVEEAENDKFNSDLIGNEMLLDEEIQEDASEPSEELLDDEFATDGQDDVSLLSDEVEEDYELDDEFIEEEEEEEALAAELDAVVGAGPDAASVQSLVDKYFDRGMVLFKKRKYEEAIIEWKKIFDVDKNNAMAKEYIEKAITLYEASPFIEEHLALGNDLLTEENYEEAIAEFEKILDIDPELEEALSGIETAKKKLAEVVIPARQTRKAATAYETVPELKPVAAQGIDISEFLNAKVLAIGGVLIIAAALVFGYTFYFKPMQEKKQAEELVRRQEETIASQKREIKELIYEAELNMGMKNFTKATELWQRIVSLDDTNQEAKEKLEITQKLEKVYKHIKAGDNMVKARQFDEAMLAYKKAQELDPDNQVVPAKIRAVEHAKRIHEETKIKVDKYLAKGHTFFSEGNYDKAIQYYRQALKLLPDDQETKESIRRAEFEKRRGKNVEANLKLGMSRYESRKFDQAKEYFNKVLELDPENQEAHFYMDKIKEKEIF